jgi:hypothetical protein
MMQLGPIDVRQARQVRGALCFWQGFDPYQQMGLMMLGEVLGEGEGIGHGEDMVLPPGDGQDGQLSMA